VVAAGVWSGQLLADATGQPAWQQLLQPRRGHLLEMQPPTGMPPVHTGMMELSYTAHYSSSSSPGHAQAAGGGGGVDITFTATTSAAGTLLIGERALTEEVSVEARERLAANSLAWPPTAGSSREFSGWGAAPSSDIINAIMRRAATFLPNLAGITSEQLLGSTRVGLRPYAVGGLPAVGPVGSALPGVYVAAGHEGSGLCLGPATAELALHHLLGSEVAPGASQQQRDALLAAAAALMPEQRLLAAAAAVGRGVDK
jgi:glycine/D-amino acid oxidase-like deaminating enzyme